MQNCPPPRSSDALHASATASARVAAAPDATLIDGVNLAVERFEVEHPGLTATLRNIVQSLQSMGI